MQKYRTIKILGDGAFGTVYKAVNTKTGQIVAIKKMKKKYTNWNQCIQLRQIKSLRKLTHFNIIKLKQVLLVSDQLYMAFQYLQYNLYQVYAKMKQQKKSFTQSQIKSMIYQIASGLSYMHKNGFFHRDLKPENLLIYNNVVKLCDMGLARQVRSRPPFTDYVSTRWYRAPELLLRSTNYNSPVDIFALGCIMAELYTLTPLFPGENEVDQLNKIVKILGTPDKNDWPQGYKMAQSKGYYFANEKGLNLQDLIPHASTQAIDLIYSMLRYSSRKRPTAAQILKHEFFKGVKINEQEQLQKQTVFEQNPHGIKLDTVQQDKNINIFRATKQKFRQTRKFDIHGESNPFKVMDQKNSKQSKQQNKQYKQYKQYKQLNKQYKSNNSNNYTNNDYQDDIDLLIKQLQQKNKKKNNKNDDKMPIIQTKQKFYKPQKKQLRQSKTQLKHGQPYKYYDKNDWKYIRNQQQFIRKKQIKPQLQNISSKQGLQSKKFSYNFQPVINPKLLSIAKNPYRPSAIGFPHFKHIVPGPAIYKY